MTHPDTPEVGGDANTPVDAKADALKTFEDIADTFFEEDEQAPEEAEEGEQPETSEESEDDLEIEAEEEELPPIEAPVSWDAEAKERFAKLPREDQEYLSKREGEREKFVQAKAQEAARARTETQQAAIQQLAEIERSYAQQYQQIAVQFDVPEPDVALLATNPTEYAMQAHQYRQAQAQRQQVQQQSEYYAQQAQQREAMAEQAYHAEQQQLLIEAFPEYLDPTTGPKFQQELSAVAREMGYPPELIAEARATDILAMRAAAEWKAKAAKYDALQAKKMEKVRSAKGLPRVATPGVAVGVEQTRQTRQSAAWERAKSGRNVSEKADGFADWAKLNGLI